MLLEHRGDSVGDDFNDAQIELWYTEHIIECLNERHSIGDCVMACV